MSTSEHVQGLSRMPVGIELRYLILDKTYGPTLSRADNASLQASM
jgi:hypothetical protein